MKYHELYEHLKSRISLDGDRIELGGGMSVHNSTFRSMLSYKSMGPYREEGFRAMHDRMSSLALAGDEVIPPYEVENTLNGRNRDIPIRVEILDFPCRYKHEDPFPSHPGISNEVNEGFNNVFETIGDFLK